jgi:hypothetical protein
MARIIKNIKLINILTETETELENLHYRNDFYYLPFPEASSKLQNDVL